MLRRLLIVEDHPDMHRFYDNLMRQVGRKIAVEHFMARNVPQARAILSRQNIDLMILDWMMPGVCGLEFLKEVRAKPEHKDILIMMVTAKALPKDVTEALNSGADDFVSKPFNVEILLARLKSLSRRKDRPWQDQGKIECAGICLDPARARVEITGKETHLHPKEMLLLEVFLRRPNVLHAPRALWDRGWSYDTENWEHILVTTISNLKKGLGAKKGALLECRRGLGYILRA